MAENKQPTFDELLKQIEDFENTIQQLAKNVSSLKTKLMTNKEKYGSDMAKWPKGA